MTYDVRKALDDIHMAACYGTEENPDAARDSLLIIGGIARKALADIETMRAASELRAQPSAEPTPLTAERLRDALVASRIISPEAVEDPDGYDDGLTLFRIEGLHRRLAGTQPSAEPSLVQAARDALVAMIDGLTPVEDGRPHHMVMRYKAALDALRRALDAGDGAGEARDAARYRWLRDANMTERNRLEHYASDALDAAIDAAIDAAMGDALRRALDAGDGAGEARPPCGLPGTLRCGLRELAINPPRNPPLWTCDNPNCSRMPRAAVDAPEAKGGGR